MPNFEDNHGLGPGLHTGLYVDHDTQRTAVRIGLWTKELEKLRHGRRFSVTSGISALVFRRRALEAAVELLCEVFEIEAVDSPRVVGPASSLVGGNCHRQLTGS